MNSCPIIQVQANVYFATGTAATAKQADFCLENSAHFVEVGGSAQNGDCVHLHIAVIHSFCQMMQATVQKHLNQVIIVCPEVCDMRSTSNACLLLGAYLILCEHLAIDDGLDYLSRAMRSPSHSSRIDAAVIMDCWRALTSARDLRWLGPSESDDVEPVYDLEMILSGAVTRLLEGDVFLSKEVTR